MIYLDSSVVLARVFAEAAVPDDAFWNLPLISSRLLLYEVWNRVHARELDKERREDIEMLLAQFVLLSCVPMF